LFVAKQSERLEDNPGLNRPNSANPHQFSVVRPSSRT